MLEWQLPNFKADLIQSSFSEFKAVLIVSIVQAINNFGNGILRGQISLRNVIVMCGRDEVIYVFGSCYQPQRRRNPK